MDRSGKYDVKESDPHSERQELHILFYMQTLACHVCIMGINMSRTCKTMKESKKV